LEIRISSPEADFFETEALATANNPEALKKGLSDWQNLCFRGGKLGQKLFFGRQKHDWKS